MHTIELFVADGHWMSDHSDPMIAELFGTSLLPTSFNASCDVGYVVDQIARLNPNARVFVRQAVR